MREAVRFGVLAFVGMLLLQTAWILAVPPYHAIDEFDHAYRAAGVARGEWVLTEQATNGRGLLVAVPPEMVEAAHAQCEALPYTQYANCNAVEERSDGLAVVATAAGQYNPLYYMAVGVAARPFDGITADYVMRGVSAGLCALAVGIAAFCLGLMGAGTWTRAGLLFAVTPMLAYTTVVPAPNSVEIVAALVVWCALIAATSGKVEGPWERRLIWLAGLAAVVAVIPRTLGPLWLAMIAAVLVVFVGRRRVGELLREHRGPALFLASVVVLAAVASAAWSAYGGLFDQSPDVASDVQIDMGEAVQPTVWTLQIIAAFPFRGDAAPIPVYALVLIPVLSMLLWGTRFARTRERVAIGGAVLATLLLPVGLTLATASSQGVIWQGRYQLPFVVGIMLLCGMVLDRQPARRFSLDALVLGALAVATAHAWSVIHVARFEVGRTSALGDGAGWVTSSPWSLGAVAALGCCFIVASPVLTCRRQRQSTHEQPVEQDA